MRLFLLFVLVLNLQALEIRKKFIPVHGSVVGTVSISSTGSMTFSSVNVTGALTAGTFSVTSIDVTGNLTAATVDINGGNIDGTVIGASSSTTGTFTDLTGTLQTAAQPNITSLGSLGRVTATTGDFTDANVSNDLAVSGTITGTIGTATQASITDIGTQASVDIDGGFIDGTPIGQASASNAIFGTVTATSGVFTTGTATNFALTNLSAGAVNVSGNLTASTGVFTSIGGTYFTGNVGVGGAPSSHLHVISGSGNVNFTLEADTGSDDSVIDFSDGAVAGGICYDHGSNSLNLVTAAGCSEANADIIIDSSGNLGTGTGVVDADIHIADSSAFMAFTDYENDGSAGALFRNTANQNVGFSLYHFGTNELQWRASTGGAGTQMRLTTGPELGVDIASPTYQIEAGTGTVAGAGAYVNTSDKRLKKDIRPVRGVSACNKLALLEPVYFNWKTRFTTEDTHAKAIKKEDGEGNTRANSRGVINDDTYKRVNQPHGEKDIGFLAQDVQSVFPQAVYGNEKDNFTIAYTKFIPLMVACMKEQQEQINALLRR